MKGDLRIKKAVELAELKDGDRVLDLGSADNVLLRYIDKKIDYTAVDYDKTRGRYINNPKEAKAYINCNLEKGFNKEIKKKKYEVIFLLEIIEHIENFKSLLQECKDVLSPNGKIIITTPTNICYVRDETPKHFHCFRKKHLINIANFLNMKYYITGVHVRIPKLNLFLPSKQTVYNDTFLMVLIK